MKIAELIKDLKIESTFKYDPEIEIKEVRYNSKQVSDGDIFVCIKGYKTDGHNFLEHAMNNGAIVAIVEIVNPELNIAQIKVDDSRKALAHISDKYFSNPSSKMNIIGITATNGKTTTSFMLNDILERSKLSTGLIGTVMVKYPGFMEPSYLTTPESLDLHRHFYNMEKANVTHVIMEVSSSALELSRVGNVDFNIVSFNNVSHDHIDLHGSFEEYYNIKSSLITNAHSGMWAILNKDDVLIRDLVNKTKAKVLTYGVNSEDVDFYVKNIDISTGRANFDVIIPKDILFEWGTLKSSKFEIKLRTPGYHSVYNAMVAIISSFIMNIDIDIIKESLATFGGVERRFEIIYEDSFKIVDDHFANEGNIEVTFKTLEKMNYKDIKLIYAIRGNRGPSVIKEASEAIVKWAPKLGIKEVTASLSKSLVTWKDEVSIDELNIFKSTLEIAGIKVIIFEELENAVHKGIDEAKNDDVVMLAGCQGMDFGAKIALEYIRDKGIEKDEEKLFKPIRNRIAGV
jgi:UDP-N-acetylmuramoyl-L-alanyl-D-glutamate--2,6-diaminopimelate ligase